MSQQNFYSLKIVSVYNLSFRNFNRLTVFIQRLIVGIGLCFFCASAASESVKIGVLSFRSLDKTQQQWQALADYLSQSIPQHRFEIVPMYYSDLNRAASENQFAFILTNPEHFVILRQHHGLSAIATLMPMINEHPVNQFGGVIIAKAERQDIQVLADLNGKTIASPGDESFGGYVMQRWELYKQGVQAKDYLFTGMPHDNVVSKVLSGEVDAGFVRTGIIEALTQEGQIDAESIKVINRQPLSGFPLAVSTDLYPEWPFASALTVDQSLVKAVSLALLSLDKQHPAAVSANIVGFSSPGDYSKVEAVMLKMNVHPERLKNINLLDFYYRYRLAIWGAIALMAVIILLSIKLFRIHHSLRRAFLKYHLVADYTSDWEYWLSPDGRVIYMSPSCLDITGYEREIFQDDPLLIERIIHVDDLPKYQDHRLNHNHQRSVCEIEFRIRDREGQLHWIQHICQPVFDRKGKHLGIRVSNRDTTERKQLELELRLHDAALKSCGDAIVITDAKANIQWVNPAFCSLTGYTEHEAKDKNPAEIVKSGQQTAEFYRHLWQTILSGKTWRGELVNRKKSGEFYNEQLSITPVYSDDQTISYFVAVKQDVTERKLKEAQIRQMAFYDPLTQLANRRLLLDRIEQALAGCKRHHHYAALLYIDLDKFKTLNDLHGHDAGDQLLIEVGKRLKKCVRQQDSVARLGGDEFVVLLTELESDFEQASRQACLVAEKLHVQLAEPYILSTDVETHTSESFEYHLSASIGISLFLHSENDADKVLKQADMAMYEAKHLGRNRVCLFN